MTISESGGSPTSGQIFLLTCSVGTVPHLVVSPSIQWTRQDGRVVNSSTGSELWLSFDSLMPTDSSVYTCQASVTITDIASVSGQASEEILLTSKYYLKLQISVVLYALLCMHRTIRCSRDVPERGWRERGDILLVSSACDPASWISHKLHPLLLPLSLLSPPVSLPVRTTHCDWLLSRHLLLLFSSGQQWSGLWTTFHHYLHHTT